MRRYWVKIGFGALLIFGVGYGAVFGIRRVKNSIISGPDITIPLGSFIHFNLDGTQLGSIRSLTIRRSSPKVVSGFEIRVRADSASLLARLENCHVSVNDAEHIDERTRFVCLGSDAGYQTFGEVRAELRGDVENRTVVVPLFLPDKAVRDFQRQSGDGAVPSVGDSIAREVNGRVRVQARSYADSVAAARLDKRAEDYKRKADSIRGKIPTPVTSPAAPKAGQPPKP